MCLRNFLACACAFGGFLLYFLLVSTSQLPRLFVTHPSLTVQGVTQLKFTTDEALLKELLEDPLLTAYSVVVVDEVHERSLSTDLLLALLRKVCAFLSAAWMRNCDELLGQVPRK